MNSRWRYRSHTDDSWVVLLASKNKIFIKNDVSFELILCISIIDLLKFLCYWNNTCLRTLLSNWLSCFFLHRGWNCFEFLNILFCFDYCWCQLFRRSNWGLRRLFVHTWWFWSWKWSLFLRRRRFFQFFFFLF